MEPIPRRYLILSQLGSRLAACPSDGAPDGHLPQGYALRCPPVPEGLEPPKTERYIASCKKLFRRDAQQPADFFLLHGAEDFRALRACVLAMTDLTGKTLIAELETADGGRMADGTDIVAAAGVLQRIGVSTLLVGARRPDELAEALERLAPYARLPVGARLPAQWLRDGIALAGVELFAPAPGEPEEGLREALAGWGGWRGAERDHDDVLLVPDGRDAHFIAPTVDVSDEIVCDHRLYESLLEAEDEEAAVLKLVLEDEEGVQDLEDDLYMLARPVCLCAETPELLEKALRAFYGIAVYDGTWELEPEILRYFEQKYGLICL